MTFPVFYIPQGGFSFQDKRWRAKRIANGRSAELSICPMEKIPLKG
jgi:hypothetical protein